MLKIKICGKLPSYYKHFQFNMLKKKKKAQNKTHKMLFGDSYVQGSEGDLGKNLQEGSMHGPTLELLRGMVHSHVLAS